jgi:hypothetical protein
MGAVCSLRILTTVEDLSILTHGQVVFCVGNDLERAFLWTERHAVQCVGDDDFRVHEDAVQLSQGEDNAISVGCFRQDIGSSRTYSTSIASMCKLPASHLRRARCFAIFLVV